MDNTTGEARPLQSPSINYNDNENVPSAIEGVRQRFTPSTTMNNEYNQGHDEEYYADNPQTTPPANDRSVRIRVNNNNNNSGRGYFYPVSPRSNNSNSPASYLGRRQSNVSFASAGADYADQNRGDDASVASNQSPRSRSGSSIHIRNLTSSVGGFDEHVYNDDDQDILMEHSRSSHTRGGHDHDHDYRDDHNGDQDFGMSRSDSTIDLEHVVYDHHQHHEEGDHYPDIHEGGVIMPDHMNADHIHIDIEEEEENDNQPSKGRAKEINITSIIDEDRPDKSSDVEENPLPFVGSSIDALKQGVNKQRTRQRDPFFESLPYKSLLSLWNQTDPCAAGRRFMLISNYESKIFTSIEDLSSYLCRKLKETLVTYTPRIDSRRSRRSYRKGGSAKRAAAPVTTSAMLPFWVDIQSPTPEDMMKIETVFHLHPLTTEDCISNSCEPNSGSNIEKWETFPKYVYVVANGQPADAALDEMPPIEDEQPSRALPSVDTVSLNVIVFDHFTLTIHKGPLKSLDVVLTRIRTGDAASNQQNAGGRGGIGMGAGGAAAGQNPRKTMFINSSIASAPLTAELKPVKSYSPAISASNSVSNLAAAAAAAAAPDRTASYYEGLLSLPEDYFPPPRAPTTQQGGNVLTEPATFGQQSESTAVPPQPQERAGEQQAKTELQQQQPQQPQLLALDKPPTKRILDSPDWILYAFLDAMVDLYMPSVDALIDEVELLDEMVFILSQEEQSDLLRRIAVARRNIASMRRILWPKQKLISYLVSKRLSYISPYVQIYMRDVLDHIISCTEKLELTKELLNQSHSNYLARVNIEVSQASNHINEVMKRLGMITTIIGPMALIPGLWGMNVKVPGQDRDGLEWFFGICVGIAVIIITLLLIFRKKLF